ncbi:type 4a pilus biogenesis protein PilO [Microcella sp.]|uniref:type 4a pilus biogenesis protein PilO n=1 Tax=Microcella sp. TaxID=1913979 RepID=UPI00391D3E01
MSTLRMWVIGAVVVSLVIAGLGWTLGVSPRLDDAARADSERQNVELVNVGYEATLQELRQLSENLPALESELDAIRREIPEGPELSALLGQLNALAESAGVEISQITADPPLLFPAEIVEEFGVTGLVAVPVRVSATGDPIGLSDFLRSVQFGTRLFLVEQFTLSESGDSGAVSLQGFVFVIPPAGTALPTDEPPANELPAAPTEEDASTEEPEE